MNDLRAGRESNGDPHGAPGQIVHLYVPSLRPPQRGARPATTTASTWLQRIGEALTEERSLRAGERHERTVSRELARLGHGWRVIHSIPAGPANAYIDHLAIGPAGVFCLYGGRFDPRDPVRVATRLYACGAGRVGATGVLVSPGSRQQAAGAAVVQAPQLRRWPLSRPQVLDTMAVERCYEVARRATTWLPGLASQAAADAVRTALGRARLRLVQV